MADLNKIQRSKERIVELLSNLRNKSVGNPQTSSYINELEKSIEIIDNKLEDFKQKDLVETDPA